MNIVVKQNPELLAYRLPSAHPLGRDFYDVNWIG